MPEGPWSLFGAAVLQQLAAGRLRAWVKKEAGSPSGSIGCSGAGAGCGDCFPHRLGRRTVHQEGHEENEDADLPSSFRSEGRCQISATAARPPGCCRTSHRSSYSFVSLSLPGLDILPALLQSICLSSVQQARQSRRSAGCSEMFMFNLS